jgi:hypothetical protein
MVPLSGVDGCLCRQGGCGCYGGALFNRSAPATDCWCPQGHRVHLGPRGTAACLPCLALPCLWYTHIMAYASLERNCWKTRWWNSDRFQETRQECYFQQWYPSCVFIGFITFRLWQDRSMSITSPATQCSSGLPHNRYCNHFANGARHSHSELLQIACEEPGDILHIAEAAAHIDACCAHSIVDLWPSAASDLQKSIFKSRCPQLLLRHAVWIAVQRFCSQIAANVHVCLCLSQKCAIPK